MLNKWLIDESQATLSWHGPEFPGMLSMTSCVHRSRGNGFNVPEPNFSLSKFQKTLNGIRVRTLKMRKQPETSKALCRTCISTGCSYEIIWLLMYFYDVKRIILAGKTSLAFLAVESFRFPIVSILLRFPVALFPSL